MFTIIPPQSAGPFSSPLAPRDVNLPTRDAFSMSPSKPETNGFKNRSHPYSSPLSSPTSSRLNSACTGPQSSPPSFYAERYASSIRNPAGRIAQRALSRDKRRDQFLNRVKRARDESTFDSRAEQMQQMECLSQRREFLESMARTAPDFGYLEEEDEDEGGQGPENWREAAEAAENARDFRPYQQRMESEAVGDECSWHAHYDEAALEEIISEEQRFEKLLEEMEKARDGRQNEEMTYDDDEYDALFANLSSDAGGNNSQSQDRMDMSNG